MKKTESSPTIVSIPSIPAARLPDEEPVKPNLKDRMSRLKAAPSISKPVTVNRPQYDAPLAAIEALSRFIPADNIRKIAEKRASNANDEASEILFKAFCESLWKHKIVPSNPKMIILDGANQPDMSAIYQVQDRFTPSNMKLPEFTNDTTEEDIFEGVVDALANAGIEDVDARKLVTAEVETSKRRNIRSLNELALGHFDPQKQWVEATQAEQSVAEKLMDFLDTLSAEEQSLIRRDETKVTLKAQFLTRVCNYAHHPLQVEAILTIFSPVNFISHAVLGLSDNESTKILKLQQAASEMIGNIRV